MYMFLHMYPFELVLFLWIPCFFSGFLLAWQFRGGTIDLNAFKWKCKNWSPFNSSQKNQAFHSSNLIAVNLTQSDLPPLLLPTPLLLLLLTTTVSTTTIFNDS